MNTRCIKLGLVGLGYLVSLLLGCTAPTTPAITSEASPRPSPPLPTIQENRSSPTPVATAEVTSLPLIPHPDWESFTNANYVRTMMIDRNGDLWTGGLGGVVHWEDKTDSYVKYTAEDGLPGNFVTAMAQAPDGSLWFGTFGGGVARFDGKNWRSYTQDDGLKDDHVLSLAIARDGTVWVGTLAGISLFDGRVWSPFSDSSTTYASIENADSMVIARDGSVWIGGDWQTGLRRLVNGKNEDWRQALGSDVVTALTIAPDGTLWVGTPEGVANYDGQNWKHFHLSDDESRGVSSIAVTQDGKVWVGFSVPVISSAHVPVDEMRESLNDLSAHFDGVRKYDGHTWQTLSAKDGLVDNEIRAIITRTDGSTCFGSYRNGVSCLAGDSWRTYRTADGLLLNRTLSVDSRGGDDFWVGYSPSAVSHFDGGSWNHYYEVAGMQLAYVDPIHSDATGQTWMAASDGVAVVNGSEWSTYQASKFPWAERVNAISDLGNGSHLISGDNGIVELGRGEARTIEMPPGSFAIADVQRAPNGTLWVADELEGVYSFDGNRWQHFTDGNGLISNLTNSLAISQDSEIWAGSCWGISKYDGKTWKTMMKATIESDMPSKCAARDIALDQQGVAWVASEAGLLRIAGSDIKVYTVHDGLAANDTHQLTIAPDGAIWITTDAGLSRFMPAR